MEIMGAIEAGQCTTLTRSVSDVLEDGERLLEADDSAPSVTLIHVCRCEPGQGSSFADSVFGVSKGDHFLLQRRDRDFHSQ